MSVDLSDTLVIGISATALFDLNEENRLFLEKYDEDKDTAIREYRINMLERENESLADGTGMPIVEALLRLNQYHEPGSSRFTEVVVMSRNSPETGVRVFNNIRRKNLDISRHAFTGGESVVDYLEAFHVDLFLTTNLEDAQKVADSRKCAVAIVQKPPEDPVRYPEGQVRIAFDGDAVLFDESSEQLYRDAGMESFHNNEDQSQDIPMKDGPYAALLRKLSKLRDRLPFNVEYSPVRIALVTARNAPAEMRVINTLRSWGAYVDAVFFLGGIGKSKVLEALRPHIFFDDQDRHLKLASRTVPSGKVPYRSDSPLNGNKKSTKKVGRETS